MSEKREELKPCPLVPEGSVGAPELIGKAMACPLRRTSEGEGERTVERAPCRTCGKGNLNYAIWVSHPGGGDPPDCYCERYKGQENPPCFGCSDSFTMYECEACTQKWIAEERKKQIAALKAQLAEKDKRIAELEKWKNPTIQVCVKGKDRPFNFYDCKIIDVGVADKIFVTECPELEEALAAYDKEKATNEKGTTTGKGG